MFLAQDAAAAAPAGIESYLVTYGPLVLMFVVLYFLLIRPQQRRQKTRNMMLGNLKKGDKVVTIGGLHGTILELNDDTVILRVNDVTKLTFDRSAVNTATTSAPAPAEEKK
ncbi:preprotein translocase subunit YajC [Paenibacillus filicis]|uniref:Preprotein translocase subunit YajC n=1 Tax=Paenibacillus gyeongsangnamensis TaxID=3388067 RepID=A0ABT4QCJ5_9BACL|nr:preprotein translocase subunit YajC [Paenibacillus filicis]MCZ8514613.1 preprotein translocase subunit YajC [Paenibacillus filicis]